MDAKVKAMFLELLLLIGETWDGVTTPEEVREHLLLVKQELDKI